MTSKIHILSDLHLEFANFNPPSTDADIIILAGDIYTGTKGLSWAREKFPHQEIIYVSGNHEYYHHVYKPLLAEYRQESKQHQIHFLENNECFIHDIRFLGCTLWTDYLCYALHSQEQSMQLLGESLADHRVILSDEKGELFTPQDALDLHQQSVQWLENKLEEDYSGKTVVITHHGPSVEGRHKIFGHNELAPGFYSDLSPLLSKADVWIYGHTHSNLNIQLDKCRLIANQRGYPNENIEGFDPALVIEISP